MSVERVRERTIKRRTCTKYSEVIEVIAEPE